MKRKHLTILVLVLSFLALADAWYLADTALKGTVPTCEVAAFSDCAEVAQSAFAKPFGIPLGIYGAMFAAAIFMMAAMALLVPDRSLYRAMFFLSAAGAVGSLGLVFVQAFVIRASCVYCIIFELLSFLLAAATFVLYRRTRTLHA